MTPKKADAETITLPDLDPNPGHKVTTIRLTNAEHERANLFATAMSVSLTEYVGRAVRAYMKSCTKDPNIRKEVERQIAKQQKIFEKMRADLFGEDADE